MRGALSLTPVKFTSPFDAVDDGSPRSLISSKSVLSSPTTAIRDLRRDAAVRRFSEPAPNENRQRMAAHIASARNAYIKAFVSIQRSAKNAKVGDLRLDSTTEKDVADMAMEMYANDTGSTEKGKASKFVNILHHYHGVFDVLSQADCPYLPLIWGSMKFILIMAENRGSLLEKVTDSLFEIGMTLSRIEIFMKLFPTTRMIELASMLYAAVVDFLQDVIAHFQRSSIRQMFSSLIRPFDEKFGRVMDRIHRLGNCVQHDAVLWQALQQSASMAHHQVDSFLHRCQVESKLNGISDRQTPDMFLRIKDALFQGFENQANFHDSMSAMYSVTAPAWKDWFGVEQQYLPSYLGPRSRFIQGLCDAPDSQHALQWAAQQRARSPDLPSAYLIWAQGMTVQSAISSLVFQIVKQKPAVLSQENIDMRAFVRANASIKALWEMFVHLMRALGGCLIYIAMGSVGPDEFAVVEKFMKTVQEWDGPTICVTIIHPNDPGFVTADDVIDIDGAYDVHPSLTTTDAIHHVLMLELDMHGEVSDTIRTACWEQVWREARYAVIGIALTEVTNLAKHEAEKLGQQRVKEGELSEASMKLWISGVDKWSTHKVASNNAREQIQQHLYLVDLKLPPNAKAALTQRLKIMVFKSDTDCVADSRLAQKQRDQIWERIEAAIRPGAVTMFCGLVPELVENALDEFSIVPVRNQRQAELAVVQILDEQFSRKQTATGGHQESDEDGVWKASFPKDAQVIVDGIVEGVVVGFRDVIEALSKLNEKEKAVL